MRAALANQRLGAGACSEGSARTSEHEASTKNSRLRRYPSLRLAGKNLDDSALARMEAALMNVTNDISGVLQFQAHEFRP